MNDYCRLKDSHPLHTRCHDKFYGFPVADDHVLFMRLLMEIFQAGLNWLIILQKEDFLKRAFAQGDYRQVALFNEQDEDRLMQDKSIIRNRRKIRAAIDNARALVALIEDYGSFKGWLDAHHPRPLDDWVILFRTHFTMTGKIVVHEFLMSTGYLEGAHAKDCPIYDAIAKTNPPWMSK